MQIRSSARTGRALRRMIGIIPPGGPRRRRLGRGVDRARARHASPDAVPVQGGRGRMPERRAPRAPASTATAPKKGERFSLPSLVELQGFSGAAEGAYKAAHFLPLTLATRANRLVVVVKLGSSGRRTSGRSLTRRP